MDIPPIGSPSLNPSKKIEGEESKSSKIKELANKVKPSKKESNPIKGHVTKEAPPMKSIPLQQIVNSEVPVELDANQIKLNLIEKKILPTIEEAKDAYWSLGSNWWKQILDGCCHQYGELVFDEGQHGGSREPGYLAGVKAGSKYFMKHLEEELTIQVYLGIHHEACAHFKRSETNGIVCDSHEIDLFRTKATSSKVGAAEHYKFLIEGKKLVEDFLINPISLPEVEAFLSEINRLYEEKFTDYNSLLAYVDEMISFRFSVSTTSTLNAAVQEIFPRINHGGFVKFENDKNLPIIHVLYEDTSALKSELITEHLLDEFNENIAKCQKKCYEKVANVDDPEQLLEIKSAFQTESLYFIARLFQELEWAHPWIDGQGRTDLILLSGLLAREGLHPCILQHPYFSTFNTLDDWIKYLKGGLEAFEVEKAL